MEVGSPERKERWNNSHQHSSGIEKLRNRVLSGCLSQIKSNRKKSISKARLQFTQEEDKEAMINTLISDAMTKNNENSDDNDNDEDIGLYYDSRTRDYSHFNQKRVMTRNELIKIFGSESYEDLLREIDLAIEEEITSKELLAYEESEFYNEDIEYDENIDSIVCPICRVLPMTTFTEEDSNFAICDCGANININDMTDADFRSLLASVYDRHRTYSISKNNDNDNDNNNNNCADISQLRIDFRLDDHRLNASCSSCGYFQTVL